MRIQHRLADVSLEIEIDYAQRAAAVADEHFLGARIETDVVRIAAQIVFMDLFKRMAVVNPHVPIGRIGDIQPVRLRPVENPLRLFQAANRVDHFPGCQVNDFHGVVAERRHKQSLAGNIDGHMVDAPIHVR